MTLKTLSLSHELSILHPTAVERFVEKISSILKGRVDRFISFFSFNLEKEMKSALDFGCRSLYRK